MIRPVSIFIAIILAFLTGLAAAQENQPPANTAAPAARSEEPGLVVARISGEPITERQVLEMINDLARQMNLPLEKLRQRNSLLFNDAVNNLITVALLKDQIRQQNLTVDKALIDQQIAQISKRYPSAEAFQQALSSQGITEPELRKNLEESIGLQQVIEGALKNVPPTTDAEIEKFYNDNPGKFAMPERVHAAHILLSVAPNSTAEQKEAVKKRLETIYAEIEAKTITFADAATKYSQDKGSAGSGGDLGVFPRGRMVKPFENAAFSTKPGTLSPIVETEFGYHIIQTLELKPAGKATLEEARPAIRQYLEQNAKQAVRRKFMEELKGKARIESFMTAEEFAKRHPAEP